MAIRGRTLWPSLAAVFLLWAAAGRAYGQVGVAPSPSAEPAPVRAPQGQTVTAIRIVDQESSAVLQDDATNLPLKPGQPFDLDTERDSLRELYRTGLYAEMEAETTPVEGGVRLDFLVRRNFYVSSVQVSGVSEPPSQAAAESSLRLNVGEIFRESDMPAAIERLRALLQGEGLYQAKISYQLSPQPETRRMNVFVTVNPGPRARVGEITVMDRTPFPESALRGQLRLRRKREITAEGLDNSTQRIQKWLAKRGYLGARVSIVRGAYDAQADEVPLEVRATAGLEIHIDVEGAKIAQTRLRQLLPFYAEGAVDEDLLEEGRRNLRDYIERQGYFEVQVNYTTSAMPATPPPNETQPGIAQQETITYRIMRGPRRRLAAMAFTGNHYFSDDLLRSRVRIQSAALGSAGRFSAGQLRDDVASITDLYHANGFRRVQVKSDVEENYRARARDFFVQFQIVEGPQTRIAALDLKGNAALDKAELSRVIDSTPGQPFSDFNVSVDRDNVLALYYNQGFSEARFQAQVQELPAENGLQRVNLTYQIEEGPETRVARVLFGGEEHTRPYVIAREIRIKAGQPLSQSEVVDTQRRLYGLRIFSRVSIAPQNPTGSDPDKTVDVVVEEASRYTIAYGLGLEAQRLGTAGTGPVAEPLRFSPRGTFEITKDNLTGRADALSFKVRASTLQGRALLAYTVPYFFGKENWALQLTGDYDKTRDVLTFTSTREEGSLQLTERLKPGISFLYRYVYRHVVASDLQISPEQIPLFSAPTEVSFVSFSAVRDRRDSPADPTQGTYNSIDVDFASRSIGSSASFWRTTLQNTTYTHLGQRLVFARSTRVSIEQPVGRTASVDIPLPERFFAGGGTTIRGFGLNQAGPRDPLTGFPVGGLGMIVFNQQLQFPMRLPLLGNRVGGAVFYDAGNVFSSIGQASLRWSPPAPVFSSTEPNVCVTNCSNNLNYFSHTVGLEFRYHTPAVPVSIDLAYQLNPARFLIPTGSTTGPCATTTCLELARLPAFQFFVNLGPSF